MTQQEQTRLGAARHMVASKRAEINALGEQKRAKNKEADNLLMKARLGDAKAEKRIHQLEAEMSGIGVEILKIERAMTFDTQNLLNIEGVARAATARLRALERAADAWLPVLDHLEPAQLHLDAIKTAMWRNSGAFSQHEIETLQRAIGIIAVARRTFVDLEEARQHVREVGAWDES